MKDLKQSAGSIIMNKYDNNFLKWRVCHTHTSKHVFQYGVVPILSVGFM
jgi:hypothetical protein